MRTTTARRTEGKTHLAACAIVKRLRLGHCPPPGLFGPRLAALRVLGFIALALSATAAEPGLEANSKWPQSYSVQRDEVAGVLTLRTAYYTVEHDLRKSDPPIKSSMCRDLRPSGSASRVGSAAFVALNGRALGTAVENNPPEQRFSGWLGRLPTT